MPALLPALPELDAASAAQAVRRAAQACGEVALITEGELIEQAFGRADVSDRLKSQVRETVVRDLRGQAVPIRDENYYRIAQSPQDEMLFDTITGIFSTIIQRRRWSDKHVTVPFEDFCQDGQTEMKNRKVQPTPAARALFAKLALASGVTDVRKERGTPTEITIFRHNADNSPVASSLKPAHTTESALRLPPLKSDLQIRAQSLASRAAGLCAPRLLVGDGPILRSVLQGEVSLAMRVAILRAFARDRRVRGVVQPQEPVSRMENSYYKVMASAEEIERFNRLQSFFSKHLENLRQPDRAVSIPGEALVIQMGSRARDAGIKLPEHEKEFFWKLLRQNNNNQLLRVTLGRRRNARYDVILHPYKKTH